MKGADPVTLFHQAAERCGYPAALLSDNAAVFSGGSRKGKVLLEAELERLGIRASHARPYHPQTCGKVASKCVTQTLDSRRLEVRILSPQQIAGNVPGMA